MAGLQDFRAQHPEYNDMPDAALADALYKKFYPDMPRDQFDAKMGTAPAASAGGSTLRHVAQGASALVKGGLGTLGLPGDLDTLGGAVADKFINDPIIDFLGLAPPKPDSLQPHQSIVGSAGLQGAAKSVGITDRPDLAPQNRLERNIVAGGEGAGAALPLAVLGPAGAAIPALVAGGAGGVAGEEAARAVPGHPTLARVAGNLAGGIGTLGAISQGMRAVNSLRGVTSPTLQAYQAAGVTPRLAGDVSGSPGAQWVQSAASNMPGGVGPMKSAARQSVDELGQGVTNAAEGLGTALTPAEAGTTLQSGASGWVQRFKADQQKLWGNLSLIMPAKTPVAVSSTKSTLGDLISSMPDAPETAKVLLAPRFQKLSDALAKDAPNGQMSYQSLSRFRTEIGSDLANPQLLDDVSRGELKRLYVALTTDMRVAFAKKSADAVKVFDDANALTTQGHRYAEDVLQKVLAKGTDPESVYKYALAQAPNGGTRLAALRKAYTPDEWGQLGSLVLRRMGMAKAGAQNAAGDVFSPATFLTNWNNLSPSAKTILFPSELRPQLDSLAKVAESMKGTSAIANSSRTAGTGMFMKLLEGSGAVAGYQAGMQAGGLPGAAAGAVAGLVAPAAPGYFASKLMTSPTFVKWLATPTAMSGVPGRLKALDAISSANPEISDAISWFQGLLQKPQQQSR